MSNALTIVSTEQDQSRLKSLESEMVSTGKNLEHFKSLPIKKEKLSPSSFIESAFLSTLVGTLFGCIGGLILKIPNEWSAVYPCLLTGAAAVLPVGCLYQLFLIKNKNKQLTVEGGISELIERLGPVDRIRLEVLSQEVTTNAVLLEDFSKNPVKFCQEHFKESSNYFILEVDRKIKADVFYLLKATNKPSLKIEQKVAHKQ